MRLRCDDTARRQRDCEAADRQTTDQTRSSDHTDRNVKKFLERRSGSQYVEVGNGRGKATVYRIRTEDPCSLRAVHSTSQFSR